MNQLALNLYGKAPPPNPNARLFDRDGNPKRLLWCADSARMGGPCPYEGREVPLGVCCKELAIEVNPLTTRVR